MIPDTARRRIERTRDALPEGWVWDYSSVTEVVCKRCGTTIMGLSPVQNTAQVILMQTAAYREKRMVFDDGSAHITSVCRDCADMDLSQDELERLYVIDLASWNASGPVAWHAVGERNPVRWENA